MVQDAGAVVEAVVVAIARLRLGDGPNSNARGR